MVPDVAFTCSCKCLFARYIRDNQPWVASCPLCGGEVTDAISMSRETTPVRLRLPGDQYDYISPQDGSHISSKRAHRDHLKKHSMVELGNEKPVLGKFKPTIPRDSIKREMQQTVERMKSHGTWRER